MVAIVDNKPWTPRRAPDLFGTKALTVSHSQGWKNWFRVENAPPPPEMLERLEHDTRGMTDMQKLRFVNGYVNASISYTPDSSPLWQTPSETYDTREGDCEDIAVLKYALLRKLVGDQSYVTVVYDKVKAQHHAICIYYIEETDTFYVLDNLHDRVLESPYVRDLVPIVTMGDAYLWVHARRL